MENCQVKNTLTLPTPSFPLKQTYVSIENLNYVMGHGDDNTQEHQALL